MEEIYAYIKHPFELNKGNKSRSHKRTFQWRRVVVLSIRSNLSIEDISIDLYRCDIALHQGVLSMAEEAHCR